MSFKLRFIFAALYTFCTFYQPVSAQSNECACVASFVNWIKHDGQTDRHVALKTNLLYDAAVVPNIALVMSFGPHFTVSAGWEYMWLGNQSRHRYWRVSNGRAEVDYWFRHREFAGHHVGVYGSVGTYDFKLGHKGIQAPGKNYSAGVGYGYTFALSRRLSLDLGLSLGWVGGRYTRYVWNCGQYECTSRGRLHYFGPTDVHVSLIWLLCRPND